MNNFTYNPYYESLSFKSDNDADRLYWMLLAAPQFKPKHMPHVFPKKPGFFSFAERRSERNFMRVYRHAITPVRIAKRKGWSQDERDVYLIERNRGQYVNEDAGGYVVRCLNALLTGKTTERGETYDMMMRRLINESHDMISDHYGRSSMTTLSCETDCTDPEECD